MPLKNFQLPTLDKDHRTRFGRLRKNFYVDTDYRILYEDDVFLVVDKPAPLAVHPVGAYLQYNLHTLLKSDPDRQDTVLKLTHRLDAETSGVLVIAKDDFAAGDIGKQFIAGTVQKKYTALIFGVPSDKEGIFNDRLGYDRESSFHCIRIKDDKGEEALTQYRVIRSTADYSLIELMPKTGRTHQLRVHLSLAGCPIVGDKIYVDQTLFERYAKTGLDDELLERLKLPRLALHASSLTLRHPYSDETMIFEAQLPAMLREFAAAEGIL